MCIHHIPGIFKGVPDRLFHLLCGSIAGCKIRKLCLHLFRDAVAPFRSKLLHQLTVLIGVSSGNQIDQTLQVTGNQDIHRWGFRQDKLTIPVIGTCTEEIKKHLIFVGGADQFCNRNPHFLCKVSCQNISKISCRYDYIDRIALLDFSIFQETTISVNIVNNLRHQTTDIDRIGGREPKSRFT